MATAREKSQEKTQNIPSVTPPEKQQVVRAIDEMVPEIITSSFNEDDLRDGATFDYYAQMTAEAYGPLVDASEVLGDGFGLLTKETKAMLVGIPCLFMEWAFRDGDFGRPFVSVRIVARMPGGSIGRFIMNDGSTGIADQLAKYTKKTGKLGGLLVAKGLNRSDYEVENPDQPGKMMPATTYYIDTTAS